MNKKPGASAPPAAIVTGGSSGIGLATAAVLIEDGFAVTLAARDPSRLSAAADVLRTAGEVMAFATDVADSGSTKALVEAHHQCYGQLDIVVHAAATGGPGPVRSMPPEQLAAALQTNVAGSFALAQQTIPSLRLSGRDRGAGWFIVISSIAGTWPTAGFASYSASKAACISLARSINSEESEFGVRACAICPGFVGTRMSRWAEGFVRTEDMLSPVDVAETVRFLTRLSTRAVVDEIVVRRANASSREP